MSLNKRTVPILLALGSQITSPITKSRFWGAKVLIRLRKRVSMQAPQKYTNRFRE